MEHDPEINSNHLDRVTRTKFDEIPRASDNKRLMPRANRERNWPTISIVSDCLDYLSIYEAIYGPFVGRIGYIRAAFDERRFLRRVVDGLLVGWRMMRADFRYSRGQICPQANLSARISSTSEPNFIAN